MGSRTRGRQTSSTPAGRGAPARTKKERAVGDRAGTKRTAADRTAADRRAADRGATGSAKGATRQRAQGAPVSKERATAGRAPARTTTAARSGHRRAGAARGTSARAGEPQARGRGPAPKNRVTRTRSNGPRGPRRRQLRLGAANPRPRARFLATVVLVVFLVFGAQLFRIQGFDASATREAAMSKRSVKTITPAMRGDILDTNGRVLAESVERFTVVADPVAIKEYRVRIGDIREKVGAPQAAVALAPLLGMDAAELERRFTKPKTRYVIIKKDVPPELWRQIRAVGVPGIAAERTASRIYPLGMAAAQTVGFVSPSDQSPATGIELLFAKTLAGSPGTNVAQRARDGYLIPGSERVDTPVVEGRDVRLTLDADLQWFAENALAKRVQDVGARTGSAVVIEVATGEIRAMANYPSYDPNDLNRLDPDNLANRALTDRFEPGSTGKLMTFAAALDRGVIKPDTGVIVPNRLPRSTTKFKDNENHPTEQLTATGVIAKSSNIGTILVGERVPVQAMIDYFHKFGIGSTTATGFPGESAGFLWPASGWKGPSRYTPLFGQGYSATAVQMTSVYQTIANKGVRMPPTLIKGTVNDGGTFVPAPAQQGVRVVSEKTATTLSRMLEEVTGPDGTASDARIKGYRVAGKTGTADFYDENADRGKGAYNGFTASFIGYAPAEAPKYVVGVFLHQPRAGMFGGALAGPVFNQIMTYLIQRDGDPESPKSPLDYHVWADHELSTKDPGVLSDARAKRDGL